jgi:hypothetical protein
VADAEEAAQRHSKASEIELIADPVKKAEAEALNGLRQYDAGIAAIHTAIARQPFGSGRP